MCYYHVTYKFQSESTLCSCLNVKEFLARNRRHIWCLSHSNGIRTYYHLVRKRTLNHLVKLANGWVFVYELSGSGLESHCYHSSAFEDLLVKDNSVSLHHRNIRLLAIELCKTKNNLSSQLMLELFQRWEVNYNICSRTDFSSRTINTSSFSLKSLGYLTRKIWNLVPQDIRSAESLSQFIRMIKGTVKW